MKDLTKGNTFLVLLKFALPLIIAGVISRAYNLIDLVVAGKFIGSDALSATGCASTLISFLSSIFWGIGVASGTVIGVCFGAKNYERIVRAIKTATLFCFAIMFVVCGLCIIFAPQIMFLLRVDAEILGWAIDYFRIYMAAMLFDAVSYIFLCSLQSIGDSKFPMIISVLSGIINLGFNLLFVCVFDLGVIGLGLATLIGMFVSFAVYLVKILIYIKKFGGSFKPEFSKNAFKELCRLSGPCIVQQGALYLSSLLVQPLVNELGKEATAGYSLSLKLSDVLSAFFHSISRSICAYSSQVKGAGLHDRYSKGLITGFILQLSMVIPILILIAIFPNPVFSIFLNQNDTACLPFAIQYVYLCFPFMIFHCFTNLMHSFYKGVGAMKVVLVSTILFTTVRIILSLVLPNIELIFNVYLALSLSWTIESIFLFITYKCGIWRKEEVKIL